MPVSMKAEPSANIHRYEELVLQNVSEIIVITDLSLTVQSWNRAAELFYGIAAAEAIGRRMSELVQFTYHGTTSKEAFNDLQQHKEWRGKVSFTNREGTTFYFLHTVKFILDKKGSEVGIMALGHNISDQQKAEDRLLQSEQFYRTLIADSLDLTLLLNTEGNIIFATPSIARILGYSEEDVLHTSAFQYIHPEDLGWALQSFGREVEENPVIKFIVVRVLKKNGEWLWCNVRGHNLLGNPAISAIAVYLHDDTPRKKITDALRESEKRFRNLIRYLQIGVLLQDANGKIEMTNSAMCRLFDISEEDLLGGKIWEIYTDVVHEDGRRFLQPERPSFKALQTRRLVKDVVMGVWHFGKQERIWIMISADPILNETGHVQNIVCSFTDITERKKLEKKSFAEKVAHQRDLAQATIDGQEKERLEMGRELHDNIGQQLTTVKLFLDLARNTADEKTEEMVNMALRNISEVINEVRSISRSLVPPTLKDLGFIESVNDLIDSLRIAQLLTIELDYLYFDEDQLPDNKKLALYRIIQEQLNNIVKHAGASHVAVVLRLTAGHIFLQIKDNGIGFDSSNVKKGLGLANIHNRAELLGGHVLLSSSPGNGCEINVSLPHVAGSIRCI
jgi:PAS domain S-box-containing protein